MPFASTDPAWATTPQQRHKSVPPGFLPSRKPERKQIDQLSERELHDLWNRNKTILSEPAASTSTYHQRLTAEQAAIEIALGMATLEDGLQRTHITQDDPMGLPIPSSPPSRTVAAKRRAVERYYANTEQRGKTAVLGLDEAMRLEQAAHTAALEKQKEEMEKRVRRGLTLPGEVLTREEMEARIWAFMNAKSTESDEEDDWDEEDDDEDPSTWFEDDEDDGRKGQPLVDPDELSDIIRVDESQWE